MENPCPDSVILWHLYMAGSNGYTLSYYRSGTSHSYHSPPLPYSQAGYRYLGAPKASEEKYTTPIQTHTISNLSASINLSRRNLKIFKVPPSATCFLDSLRILQLQNNLLKTVPLSLFSLSGLEELNLGNNELISLPAEIGKLSMLRELYIHGNKISELPQQISLLGNLEILDVSYNNMMYFPVEIRQLSQLKTFWTADNLFKISGSKVTHKNSFKKELSLFCLSLQVVGLKLDTDPHFYCHSNNCYCNNSACFFDSSVELGVSETRRPKTPSQTSQHFNNLYFSPRNISPFLRPSTLLRSGSVMTQGLENTIFDEPDENPLRSVLPCLKNPLLKHIFSTLSPPSWRPNCSLCQAYLLHPGLKIPDVITGPTNQLLPVTYTACSTSCRYRLISAMDLAKAKSSRSLSL